MVIDIHTNIGYSRRFAFLPTPARILLLQTVLEKQTPLCCLHLIRDTGQFDVANGILYYLVPSVTPCHQYMYSHSLSQGFLQVGQTLCADQ